MTVYLDICCLKRPFDDQSQARIALETAAVFSILRAVVAGRIKAVRSLAHELENSRNPDARRAVAVKSWLDSLNPLERTPPKVIDDLKRFAPCGIGLMDAFHLAWAEYLGADVLLTTDERFLRAARRLSGTMRCRVLEPIALVRELET